MLYLKEIQTIGAYGYSCELARVQLRYVAPTTVFGVGFARKDRLRGSDPRPQYNLSTQTSTEPTELCTNCKYPSESMSYFQPQTPLAPQQASNLGQTIAANRFVLSRRIGKGGFGDVYEGCDIWTNEDCAVKLVRGRKTFFPSFSPISPLAPNRNELPREEVTCIVNIQRIRN